MEKNIECEIRADVSGDFEKVLEKLSASRPLLSKTKRLSVMFFGKTANGEVDVRIRITNGQAEIAVKKGDWHAADRVEINQPISAQDFIGFVKLFLLLDFDDVRVGERESYNFSYDGDIIASLIKAKDVAYLEIEKITAKSELEVTLKVLHNIADDLGVPVLAGREEFLKLCSRLAENVDWTIKGEDDEFRRLEGLLKNYTE